MAGKILIIVGGGKRKLDAFSTAASEIGLDITTASFSEIEFDSASQDLRISELSFSDFETVYIRMVGKRLEEATLLVNWAKQMGIRVVDRVYQEAFFIPPTISKAIETRKLIEKKVTIPKTIYANLKVLKAKAPQMLGFPFVIKSTSGRKAREVWLVENEDSLDKTFADLLIKQKKGMRFFAQEFIPAVQRIRVLIVGEKVLGAITRPTKWGRLFNKGKDIEKRALSDVPQKYINVSLGAAQALGLEIAGVDLLEDEKSQKVMVIEANAAPSWRAFAKETGINVEKEILKYLASLI